MTATVRADRSLLPLEEADYGRFQSLLLERCGLYFSDKRLSELDLSIRHAFAASQCTSLDEYYALLTAPNSSPIEMDRLINAATINETHFFRDEAQFNALYHHVLPQLIERQRPRHLLRIWSAGCASGEEPYSIAMLLRELLPDADDWAITILGTDINTEALERARRAVYGQWAFRESRAAEWRARYFRPVPGNRYELTPAIREMVTFQRLNLAESNYPSFETNTTALDLILCRNVTIYFSSEVTSRVVEHFYEALVEGGWLVVGHAEPSLVTYRRFQVHTYPDTVLYQRDAHPATTLAAKLDDRSTLVPFTPIEYPSAPPPAQPDWLRLTPEPLAAVPVAAVSLPQLEPLEQAREWLEYGHTEQARDTLLDVVQQQPNNAAAYTLLGQAYANLGEWPPAEHYCLRATHLDALALPAYYTLALVLQHQQEIQRAIDAMRTVTYLDRNNVLGHYGLANLYYVDHQLPRAQKSLDNARRVLASHADDEMITGSGGITIGRLREAIIRQQQQWNTEPTTQSSL